MVDDQGILGNQRIQGGQGILGDQVTQGDQEILGNQGTQGAQGVQGNQGSQATQGTQIQPGLQGLPSSEQVFQSFAPYPEIKVEEPNLLYAEILMDDFSGVISEFTAVNQYTYHASDFVNLDEYLINMWTKIANVERGHMRALSRLIILLGGRPAYRGSASTNGEYWYGGFVKYGNTVCDQLHGDLQSELQAIENYKQHILMIKDGYIQQILERIIRDEEVHVKNFQTAIAKYCGGTTNV